MSEKIEEIRKKIDSIDDAIVRLLEERASLSLEIGMQKHEEDAAIEDPGREASILERLKGMVIPPLTYQMVEDLYRLIFSISRSLQSKKRIAYLGPEGSYSHQAAYKTFRFDSILIPKPSIDSVINEVISGRVDLGIVPVENSTEGMINQTLDLMASSRLYVYREIMLPIVHHLLSKVDLSSITHLFSHPQAIAQCRDWINSNLPKAKVVEMASTSEAAMAAARHASGAAIASEYSAELYGLNILASKINDNPDNITRFWVISRHMAKTKGKAKTSIILTLENVPGALYRAIGTFARQEINLTKIESRPSKKNPWEYLFFIDIEGNLDEDDNVRMAMEDVKACTKDIKILGSYPEGGMLT